MKPERRLVSRETARLLPIIVPVALSGFALLAFAIGEFVASGPDSAVLAGVLALLLAATFVEAHPVPIEGISSEGISLAAVFIVGTAVIYGWAPAVDHGLPHESADRAVPAPPRDSPFVQQRRLCLGGGAAGIAASVGAKEEGVASLLLQMVLAAAAFYAINIPLIAAIIARWSREPFLPAPSQVRLLDGRAVLDHGVRQPHARGALGALAAPRHRARRAASRDRALPASLER